MPTADFLQSARAASEREGLESLVLRVMAGNHAELNVPTMLSYRLAALSRRWAPELRVFITQVLENSGNLDHFLCQEAAPDHHSFSHGLLAASIRAAEIAMDPAHDATSMEPLPRRIPELQQVCAATAFLFDMGKLLRPQTQADSARSLESELRPYIDLTRCWRSTWEQLARRNPVLAGWLHQLACDTPAPIRAVASSRRLVRYAVISSWAE